MTNRPHFVADPQLGPKPHLHRFDGRWCVRYIGVWCENYWLAHKWAEAQ